MKLHVNFDQLWGRVSQMGAKRLSIDIGDVWQDSEFEFDDQLSSSGIEVSLDDLSSGEGLLSVRGRQVLLFIPDHGSKVSSVIDGYAEGNKFHIADCSTLDKMKRGNRFERYKVTNNMSGNFSIWGTTVYKEHIEGEAKLLVCKNCINQLNYKNAANVTILERNKLVKSFDLEVFFMTFSSLFKRLPKHHAKEAKKGYSEDWKKISAKVRQEFKYTCQHCKVDLSTDKGLLHVHHKNGEKSDNSSGNLVVLCADCHRKEPFHGHMFVKHEYTQRINELRNQQGIYSICDWPSVKRKADPALFGIIEHCILKGYTAPKVAYKLESKDKTVSTSLELAWPERRFGVVLNKPVAIDNWNILSLKQALDFFGKRKKIN